MWCLAMVFSFCLFSFNLSILSKFTTKLFWVCFSNGAKALTAEITRVDGVYEILYVAYNAAAQQLDGSSEATPARLYSLTNEVHQLFEFAVLNLVAIEKIMKKHDKAHKSSPQGPAIRKYVEQETFMYGHMVQSPLYRRLPDLYTGAASKFESTHYCNVCVSQVPYALQLDCSHVLCLRCASNMRTHFFTRCPTCRKECNLSPIYAKAKELLGQAPNPSFSLLQLDAPIDPQHQQHSDCKQHAAGMHPGLDGSCSSGTATADAGAMAPLFRNLLASNACGPAAASSRANLLPCPHQQYGAAAMPAVGRSGGANVSHGQSNIFAAEFPLDLDILGITGSGGNNASDSSSNSGGACRDAANDVWLELGLDLSSIPQHSGRGGDDVHSSGQHTGVLGLNTASGLLPATPYVPEAASLFSSAIAVDAGSRGAHLCRGTGGACRKGDVGDGHASSIPGHRRPLKTAANDCEEGPDEDTDEMAHYDPAASPDRQVPGLTGTLAATFTRNALRSGPSQWRALKASAAAGMTAEDDKLIQELRRKAMSCVYAERARKKRLGKLKDATGKVGHLDRRNKALEDENKELRRELAELKAHIRRSNGTSGFVNTYE